MEHLPVLPLTGHWYLDPRIPCTLYSAVTVYRPFLSVRQTIYSPVNLNSRIPKYWKGKKAESDRKNSKTLPTKGLGWPLKRQQLPLLPGISDISLPKLMVLIIRD